MRKKSRWLGWAAVAAAGYWLYFDYQGKIKQAIVWGWATLILAAAHIATAKR